MELLQRLAGILLNQGYELFLLTLAGDLELQASVALCFQPANQRIGIHHRMLQQNGGRNARHRGVVLREERGHDGVGRLILGTLQHKVLPAKELAVSYLEDLHAALAHILSKSNGI